MLSSTMAESNEWSKQELTQLSEHVEFIYNELGITSEEKKIEDETLLTTLNLLRTQEQRPTETAIIEGYTKYTPEQKQQLLARWIYEIVLHKITQLKVKAKKREFNRRLFMNKTEYELYNHNRTKTTRKPTIIKHVTWPKIHEDDLSLYSPNNEKDHSKNVYVTDTDPNHITTVTWSNTCNTYIATHTLGVTYTGRYSDLMMDFNDKFTERVTKALPGPAHSMTSVLSGGFNTGEDNTPSGLSTPEGQDPFIPFGKAKTTHNLSITPIQGDYASRQIKKLAIENKAIKKELTDLKTTFEQPPEIGTTEDEVSTIRDDMNKLQKLISDIMIGTSNQVEEAKKQFLEMSDIKTTKPATKMLFTLQMPDNIIEKTKHRYPEKVSALKPATLVATIGHYDTEKDPNADFRDCWERIIEYTKPYEVYEYEYVQILMAVMRGQSATLLNSMIKESDSSLSKILEALQDIFVPQHTIYDDYDEINKFKRNKNENIRTTVRRASLLIYKLRDTCSAAAWPERRVFLIMNMIKQLLSTDTLQHLHSKEVAMLRSGKKLSLEAFIDIISLYELAHNTMPKQDIPLKFNVNSMTLIEQPVEKQADPTEKAQSVEVNAVVRRNNRSKAPKDSRSKPQQSQKSNNYQNSRGRQYQQGNYNRGNYQARSQQNDRDQRRYDPQRQQQHNGHGANNYGNKYQPQQQYQRGRSLQNKARHYNHLYYKQRQHNEKYDMQNYGVKRYMRPRDKVQEYPPCKKRNTVHHPRNKCKRSEKPKSKQITYLNE